MPFGFLNVLMLLGLAGVAIPPLIHLLNRRRFNVVDWGAMQFLQISETTRRRLLIEEVLLMMLRMGLIAIMVLALAAPFAISPWLTKLMSGVGGRPNRDVVIVFDGSYSMGWNGAEKTPHEAAKEWALAYVDDLGAGDSVALLQAKQQVVYVLGEPSVDLDKVRQAIRKMPEPRGGCNWPLATRAAYDILQKSRRPLREIVILRDSQRVGWSDERSLLRWELMVQNLPAESAVKPTVWVVNIGPKPDKAPPNWALAPLRATRAVALVEQEVRFHTAVELSGQDGYTPPYRLRLEVDGQLVKDLTFPRSAELEKGQVPLPFTHRFTTPGSHLVSLIVEPDPPPGQRPSGYKMKDELPGDNRQDLSVEVLQKLPILVIDGDTRPAPKFRGSDFLRDALAPARDKTPAILVKVVPVQEFKAEQLHTDLDRDRRDTAPRVLVLCDVARLSDEQDQAIAAFLNDGGSVLVTLGERADAAYYNEHLFRNGDGWLPAKLEEKRGKETEENKAIRPLPASFYHPALALFRESESGSLVDARFPRWWKVTTPGRNSPSTPIGLMSNTDPFFVERPVGQGRVILCTVPMDNSWRTNLPELLAFAPLAHELIHYLAGARATDFNLRPGQPLRYRPEREETPSALTLQPPEGKPETLPDTPWPPVFENTRETGVYTLKTSEGKTLYYVVQADLQESDLTTVDDSDRDRIAERVGERLPIKYESELARVLGDDAAPSRMELWWLFMLCVTVLLLSELWLTRRIALQR